MLSTTQMKAKIVMAKCHDLQVIICTENFFQYWGLNLAPVLVKQAPYHLIHASTLTPALHTEILT
jgi:hypothetical protein